MQLIPRPPSEERKKYIRVAKIKPEDSPYVHKQSKLANKSFDVGTQNTVHKVKHEEINKPGEGITLLHSRPVPASTEEICELRSTIEELNIKLVGLEAERNELRNAVLQASYTPAAFLSDDVNIFLIHRHIEKKQLLEHN